MPTTSPGMLETNGRVDIPNMRMAAKLADPLEGRLFSSETAVALFSILKLSQVTFHRAFDMTRDFDEGGSSTLAKKITQLIRNNSKALKDVSEIEGVTRILTRWVQVPPNFRKGG